MNDSDNGFIFV
jgi:hypothetical protein